ncbi:MAG: recombination protein NinB [Desulfobacteraceae bacterium]|nr:recombination protein NinB [Desulfobacteraceae bacterium]
MIITNEIDKDRVMGHIKALNIDKPWSVDIKLYKKNRSLAQNKLLWKYMGIIGDELGYDPQDCKDVICQKLLGTECKVVMGETITVIKGTSKLNTKEFAHFIEAIIRFAIGDLGIKLPTNDDLYFESQGIRR